jgi:hypothetical protein
MKKIGQTSTDPLRRVVIFTSPHREFLLEYALKIFLSKMLFWMVLYGLLIRSLSLDYITWNGDENPLYLSTRRETSLENHSHPNLSPHKHDCADQTLKFKLSELPVNGSTIIPWSDSYWPNYQGGLANRWSKVPREGFGYKLSELSFLRTMNFTELSQLSPAEKYDIFQRRYDYPTVKSEWNRTKESDPTWVGICHGWANAAIHYFAPKPINVTNLDNITIPFASSDVKALLSYHAAMFIDKYTPTPIVGKRCNVNAKNNSSVCRGTNPASFHLMYNLIIIIILLLVPSNQVNEFYRPPQQLLCF